MYAYMYIQITWYCLSISMGSRLTCVTEFVAASQVKPSSSCTCHTPDALAGLFWSTNRSLFHEQVSFASPTQSLLTRKHTCKYPPPPSSDGWPLPTTKETYSYRKRALFINKRALFTEQTSPFHIPANNPPSLPAGH